MPVLNDFADLFFFLCIPLVAGLLLVAVAATRKSNTYSPILAFGMILIGSVVFMVAGIAALTVLSIITGSFWGR